MNGQPARHEPERSPDEVPDSLTLTGAISLGTGVMIGAGIFAITGQTAMLTGKLFPLAFLVAAAVVGVSAYSYVKLANAYPSSGGIAMFLKEEYGLGTATGVFSVFMYVSMVINESLVARTFGSYVLQVAPLEPAAFWAPALGVVLLVAVFGINLAGNRVVQPVEATMAAVKVAGLALFAVVGLWLMDPVDLFRGSGPPPSASVDGFLAAVAIAVLAYKGFTTITNSGGELVDPHRNVGRAIIISIGICTAMYLAVTVAVAGNLGIDEIIAAQDFALAEAARPALGNAGLWFTVALAVVATASGVIASVFAASRMLAMLTRMHEVPHRHFGLPGTVRTHATVYTVLIAIALTALFDLRQIATLGAIFYLVMDIAIHWGILRHLRDRIEVMPGIVIAAIALDGVVLASLVWVKATSDPLVLYVSAAGIACVWLGEWLFMRSHTRPDGTMDM
jgi:amino acid transporter